jgi:hypothetical protein
MKTTIIDRHRDKTIAALQRLASDSAAAPKMRRAATLRLGRLRAASATAKPLSITTRTNAPKPAPNEKAIFEAVQSFRALSRQRSVLFNKRRRTEGEREILATMTALMPGAVPQGSDPKAWSDFVGRIDLLLEEIRSIKTL